MTFFQWSNSLGPILKKTLSTKYLGFSLGVNRMWTKRNEHAPKSKCADFFKYIPKKGKFETKKFKFDPFSCLLWAALLFTSLIFFVFACWHLVIQQAWLQ